MNINKINQKKKKFLLIRKLDLQFKRLTYIMKLWVQCWLQPQSQNSVEDFLTSILNRKKDLLPNFWNKGPSFQISISNLRTGALCLTKLGNSLRPAEEVVKGIVDGNYRVEIYIHLLHLTTIYKRGTVAKNGTLCLRQESNLPFRYSALTN